MAQSNLDKRGDIMVHASGGGSGASIGGAISGSPTDGSVLFVGTGGVLAQDNANFFWDDTNNQLMLGLGTAANPSYSFAGDPNTGMFSAGADQVSFATAGSQRWRITASGHLIGATDNTVDIGAATATRPRHVYIGTDVWVAGVIRRGNGSTSEWLLSIGSSAATYSLGNGNFRHAFTGTVASSGAHKFFELTPSANTNQTLSTEINGFAYNTFTREWATGAITSQREFVVNAPTYGFVGASTITTAATLYVSGAPIAGTNATITTSHAAWFGAKIRIDAGVALGGGSAPTLGTIGGSGPATAAQNEWIEIHTNNGKRFVPAWA